jgi:hypothetical protein
MKTKAVNEKRKSWATAIRRRRILSSPEDSKLCFVLHEINSAAQNELALASKVGRERFSRNSKIIKLIFR